MKKTAGSTSILIMQLFLSLGNALVGIFYPFLLMDTFSLSFSQTMAIIGIEYGCMGILVYPIHRFIPLRIPQKIALGIGFLALSMFMLSSISPSPENLSLLFPILAFSTLSLSFLWPAFHWVNISLIEKGSRGNFLGNVQGIIMASLLVGPFIAGYIIDIGYGASILFAAGILYLFSLISALSIPAPHNPELGTLRYTTTFFREKTTENSFAQMSIVEAIQTSSLMLVYPILLKISLKSYALMGSMFFLMAIVEIITAKIVGILTDKYSSKKIMKWGALARFLDIAPRGLLAFFPNQMLASTLSISAGILGPLFGVSFYAQMYERAETSGDIYSFVVTREWILGIARCIFFLLTGLAFSIFGPLALAFSLFLAGILSFILREM